MTLTPFFLLALLAPNDLLLDLDFSQPIEGGFRGRTGRICTVAGQPRIQDGALLANQFSTASVSGLPQDRGLNQLTLSLWLAPSERPVSYQSLLYKGQRHGNRTQRIWYYLSLFDGRPEFKLKDASGKWIGIMRNGDRFTAPGIEPVPLAKLAAVKPNVWSHVAATFDHGQVVIYLNGEPYLSATIPLEQLVPNDDPLLLGEAQAEGGPRSYLFRGLLDDIKVRDRALSAADLKAEYDAERAVKPAGPLTIDRPLPEGYDPEFKTTLPLVKAYDEHPPAPLDGRQPLQTKVALHHGMQMLEVNGQTVYPMAMMPEPYAADDQVTLSCHDFAAAGLTLYSEIFWSWMAPRDGCHSWWLGEGKYDFDRIGARVRAVLAANPQGLLLPRLKLNPPGWWLKAHPDDIARNADGSSGQQASLASEAWEAAYETMLRDVVGHMEQSDYAGRIFGYHPAGGSASEWFWWGKNGEGDYSPAAIARYRKWLSDRYGGDLERLRAAWGDPEASFETAGPPPPGDRTRTDRGILRNPATGEPVADYLRFLSAMVSRNIARSCRIAKETCGGRKVVGVFYGYSAHSINQDGFRGLEAVLNAPEVDFLASPTVYDHRRGGEVGNFVSAYTASYRLHHKLFWDEVDTRTHLYPGHEAYRTESLSETLAVHQRAVGRSLASGTALWWFLLAGNATFHQAEVIDDIARLKQACEQSLGDDRRPLAEVAVFADEDSNNYLGGEFLPRRAIVRDTLDELACMGAPYDVYLLSDIAHAELPEYKLYVFLNAFRIEPALRTKIEAVVRQRGRTALWVFAPGLVGQGQFDEQGPTELTGIRLRPGSETVPCELTPCDVTHPITAGLSPRRENWSLGPAVTVDDPQATVLATTTGKPSLAVREFENWRSVYSFLPPNRDLLRGVCRSAGVHVWSETGDPFFANTSYATLHTGTAGPKRITLPAEANVTELVTGKSLGRLTVIEETLPAGVSRIYRTQRSAP